MTARRRRIVVAVDASPASIAACEAAAALAAARGADLVGVFVEDTELLRSALVPGRRELGIYTSRARRLEPDELEAQLRVRAIQARHVVETSARGARVEWSFQVVRGSVATELGSAAAGADVTLIGQVGWSPIGRRHVGSTVRALLARAPRLLVLQPGRRIAGPIRVVLEPGAPIDELADAAAALATHADAEIQLVSFAPDEGDARRLAERAIARLEPGGLTARARWLGERDGAALAHAAADGAGVLVVAAGGEVFRPELLNEISTPVMLVREPDR